MILDPMITVECNRCGHSEEYHMTILARASWDCRNLKQAIEKDGWIETAEDYHLCQDCAKSEADSEKPRRSLAAKRGRRMKR